MSPQKPTPRGASKRPGLPRRPALTPPEAPGVVSGQDSTTSQQSSAELSILVSMLGRSAEESPTAHPSTVARSAEVEGQGPSPKGDTGESAKFQIPSSKGDWATPNSQLPTPKEDWATPNSQLPTPNEDTEIGHYGLARQQAEDRSPRDAAAFDEVARSLAAAEGCVTLLGQSTGLLRLAALDVVKAETARAGGLLQLLRFLRGEIAPAGRPVAISAVMQRVLQAVEAERRLRAIALTAPAATANSHTSTVTRPALSHVEGPGLSEVEGQFPTPKADWETPAMNATFFADETLLANTLLALLVTTFTLVETVQNPRVDLSVTISEQAQVELSIRQDHVNAPQLWLARTNGDEFAAEGGGIIGAVAMAAARRLAHTCGGTFVVGAPARGSILTITLPLHTR